MDPQPSASITPEYSSGGSTGKLIIIVVLALLLVAALGFGTWSYSKMRDYKNNTDKKINQALIAKSGQLQTQAQNAFDAVNTYRYDGSPTYGSVTFRYPKTWSAYVDTTSSSEPINGYFNPSVVPSVQSKTAMALRVELLNQDYSQVVSSLSSNITSGLITSKAYVPPKLKGVPNVTPGLYLTGHINPQDQTQSGSMVVIKVRDKTLEVYTESADYQSDFDNIVLAGLTFAP